MLIGGFAGRLAGLVMKGRGFSVPGNIVFGIVGAFIGGSVRAVFGIVIGGGV